MSENQAAAVIMVNPDGKIATQQTPEQILNLIAGVTLPHVPMIEVTGKDGETIVVNASQISYIAPAPGGVRH